MRREGLRASWRSAGRTGRGVAAAATLLAILASGRCTSGPEPLERLVAEIEAGRIPPGRTVRIAGTVTGTEAGLGLTYVSDGHRGIALEQAQRPRRRQPRRRRCDAASRRRRPALHRGPGRLHGPGRRAAGRAGFARGPDQRPRPRAAASSSRCWVQTVEAHGAVPLMHLSLQGLHVEAAVERGDATALRRHLGNLVRVTGVVNEPQRVSSLESKGRLTIDAESDITPVGRTSSPPIARRRVTSIAAIRAMSPADAAAGHDVEVVATATFVHAGWNSLFVQDATAGIFVLLDRGHRRAAGHAPRRRARDHRPHGSRRLRADARGTADPGQARRPPAAGGASQPRPHRQRRRSIASWSTLRGVVRAMQRNEDIVRLEVAMPRDRYDRPSWGAPGRRPPGLGVDARVRLSAVVGARYNTRRQITGTYFQVPVGWPRSRSRSPRRPIPFALPTRGRARRAQLRGRRRVGLLTHMHGIVLAVAGAVALLRDDTGAVQVYARRPALARAGDVVDVVGFPRADGFTPILEDARVRRVGAQAAAAAGRRRRTGRPAERSRRRAGARPRPRRPRLRDAERQRAGGRGGVGRHLRRPPRLVGHAGVRACPAAVAASSTLTGVVAMTMLPGASARRRIAFG